MGPRKNENNKLKEAKEVSRATNLGSNFLRVQLKKIGLRT